MTTWRDDPKVGMLIVARHPQHRHGRIARRIIEVTAEQVQTAGMGGAQRNRWMSRKGLRRYDLRSEA